MANDLIAAQLKQLPASPGVYLMKDAEGDVLYVGKATNLRNRVKSYFTKEQKLSVKLQQLRNKIYDFEFFITGSEHEALILELNLIKKYRPRYNAQLKDDKSFPYLKISTNESWPKLHITRRPEANGGRYFGPFACAKSLRRTVKVIKDIFPLRSCSKEITDKYSRPCLDYHIHNCLAPCIGAVSKEDYNLLVKQVILFLEGKQEIVIQELISKMKQAVAELDFEQATILRDQIQAVNRVIEGQRIATTVKGVQDVIAYISDKDRAYFQVFFVRDSKLIGRESFILQGIQSEEPQQIMTSFIEQFYNASSYIPPILLTQYPVENRGILEEWLQRKSGTRVHINVPQRGDKKKLVDIAAENARQGLVQLNIRQLTTRASVDVALAEIKSKLLLSHKPHRIEGYDISNIGGTAAVGSMVVFENGKPKPSCYRRFRIKTVPTANDYAMLQEVLIRRFKQGRHISAKWAPLPDLILIDGGRGQLNAALAAIHETGIDPVPIAGLAKEKEVIFIPQSTNPILLPSNAPGLQLLQRLRDEAHRFALSYHRKVRKKETFNSIIDSIPNIGDKRKQVLLKRFGSVEGIRKATIDDLTSITGISEKLARKIKGFL